MAKDKLNNMLVALKVVKKEVILQYDMADLLSNEIKIQTFLNHPNIIKLYGYFHDKEYVYLIQEFAEDELFSELKR